MIKSELPEIKEWAKPIFLYILVDLLMIKRSFKLSEMKLLKIVNPHI